MTELIMMVMVTADLRFWERCIFTSPQACTLNVEALMPTVVRVQVPVLNCQRAIHSTSSAAEMVLMSRPQAVMLKMAAMATMVFLLLEIIAPKKHILAEAAKEVMAAAVPVQASAHVAALAALAVTAVT